MCSEITYDHRSRVSRIIPCDSTTMKRILFRRGVLPVLARSMVESNDSCLMPEWDFVPWTLRSCIF